MNVWTLQKTSVEKLSRPLRVGFFLTAFVLLTGPGFAQLTVGTTDLSRSFLLRPAALAFGGAYRALATSAAAIQINPAGLALKPGKVGFAADYAYQGHTNSSMWGVSAYDGATVPSGAFGVAYDRDTPTILGVGATVQQVTLAYAQQLPQQIYVGASLKGYLTSFNLTGSGSPDGVDADLGVIIKSIPNVSMAFVVHNLGQGSSFEEFPLMVSGGVALELLPYARFAVDVVKNFNTPAAQSVNAYMGGEVRLAQGVYGRGGFGLDNVSDNNFYALGLGLEGPKMALGLLYSQRLNPTDSTLGANVELFF